MVSRPTHIEIYGDDPEKLAAFYRSIFGWRVERIEGIDYWRIHADPEDTASVTGGITRRPRDDPGGWLQFVNTESIDEAIAEAQRLGARLVRPKTAVPRTAWVAVMTDPAGNHFAIWQPDAKAFPAPDHD